MDHVFAVKMFGALFAIMNPVTNLPIFLSVTAGAPVELQRQIALKVALYSLVMGGVFAVGGTQVLALFAISIDDFRVAGGLVVLMIGLNMLNGSESTSHHGSDHEKAAYPSAGTVAFYPLTFPIIIGPGTITALILFAGQAETTNDRITYAAVFVGLVALLAVTFWFGGTLGRMMRPSARVVMSRLMGMILAAIAVDMIAGGLKALLPGLA